MADLQLALQISGSSASAQRSVRQLQGALRDLGATTAQTQKQLDAFGALKLGAGIATGFGAVQAAMAGVMSVAGGVGEAIFGANSRLEQATARFTAFTRSAGAAADIVEALRREADVTPFDTAEMIAAGQALISSARGSQDALMDLIKTAEILAALNPAQGLEGAAVAIREALGGDFESLINRFDLSREAINRLRAEGVPAIEVIRRALAELGADRRLIDQLANTFEGRKSTIVSFFDEIKRRLGEGIFVRVSEAMGRMVDAIAKYGEQFYDVASLIGSRIGAVFGRLATHIQNALLGVLDRFAPDVATQVREALAAIPDAVADTGDAAKQAAPAVERFREALTLPAAHTALRAAAGDVEKLRSLAAQTHQPVAALERALLAAGQHTAELQRRAQDVRDRYDAQLRPLERQLRALQQARDLQTVNRALAANRATQEGLILDAQIEAARQMVGNVDPNDPALDLRERIGALMVQEMEQRREALRLEQQQAPAIATLEDRIQEVRDAQEDALTPIEAQLKAAQDTTDALEAQRRAWQLIQGEIDAAVEGVQKIAPAVGKASDDAVREAQKRQDPFRQAGEAWADAIARGWDAKITQGGLWTSITDSANAWYDATGKAQLNALGGKIGVAVAEGIADALFVETPWGTGSAQAVADWIARQRARQATTSRRPLPPPPYTATSEMTGAGADAIAAIIASEAATDPGADPELHGARR